MQPKANSDSPASFHVSDDDDDAVSPQIIKATYTTGEDDKLVVVENQNCFIDCGRLWKIGKVDGDISTLKSFIWTGKHFRRVNIIN